MKDNPALWRALMFVAILACCFVAKAHLRGADVIILELADFNLLDRKA